ncbi:LOW QUALITY PROTEIN: transcription factor-like 5 protein [Brienomyrus brachyistius]|uniref:LOW QUALITY PROTEIN: transcription factor-like 5 protein n=1 Tax=Brienomyrus brachyistius TaxID=42636 RepID=UPI0020B34C22|nr:LOW QUALITY PROTEIN: transcription factor-like 5 protein [Brienomyrus brachyistius]
MSSSSDAHPASSASGECCSASAEVTLGPAVNGHGLADFSLVEMTEVEYTHLQHIIYSHMEAAEQSEPGDAGLDIDCAVSFRLSTQCSPVPPTSIEGDHAAAQTLCPAAPRSGRTPSPHGHNPDFPEIITIPAGDPANERTPNGSGVVPEPILARAQGRSVVARGAPGVPSETRPSPTARVCLEKRFEMPHMQASHEQGTTLSSFLSMLHHPSELLGGTAASEPIKCLKMGQGRLPPPGATEGSLSSHGQSLTAVRHTVGPAKYPRNFSFQQDSQPPKVGFCKSVAGSEVWVKLEADKAPHKPALPVRRARANLRPGCLERHTLSDIQNAVRAEDGATGIRKASVTGESLQRREKHNSMERDRRRRIRICCDELNKLVPFCSFDTDKATTLQWTTAFLKYLKEIYGDSLKQEFQNVFCGQTGKRIKLGRVSDPAVPYSDPSSPHAIPDKQN